MQEKFESPLPGDFIIPKGDNQVKKAIEAIFCLGARPYANLTAALTEENKDKFGSPKFDTLTFEVKRFDPETLTGRLRIQYNMQLAFSCSGIITDLNNQHSYWNFEIDAVSSVIYFIGDEYGDLRSTANEF